MKKEWWKLKKSLAIAGLALVTVVSGCSGSNAGENGEAGAAADGDKGEITVLYVGDQFWQDQAKEFEQVSGIKVNYEVVNFTEQHDKLATAFAGGSTEYDIVHVRDDFVAEFAPKGFLTPLDDLITEDMKANISDNYFTPMMNDGQIYGFPRYLWPWQFYYNKELFAEAGIENPPSTWAEFTAVAEKLKAKGITPYAEPWGETFSYTPFIVHLRSEGGEFWDEEQDIPTFNSPEGVRALQFMADMNLKSKIISPQSVQYDSTAPLADAFAQGTIAMMMNAPHTYPLANNPETSKITGQVGVALVPGAELKTASYAETGGLAIPASSKNKEQAMEYIKFVTSTEQEKAMAIGIGRIPADNVALQDTEVQEANPHFASVAEQMEYPYGMFKHEKAAAISTEVSRHISAAVAGRETPEEALKAAEANVLKMIGK
ncbi:MULTISPECIES: ABC transporter substrate-binding protein [Paenibacillus]|uniref:ABC transporter substrate-binding protein n=1 Tax=Paenibacillus TaxID=44249 RepID=UPI001389785B|nr:MULTISPECIES: sugar ABC transporter substrate-binding protein [Paenibacillus]MBE7680197.1 extracellular solute-binding protein [Paenibacillus sp. P13VS]